MRRLPRRQHPVGPSPLLQSPQPTDKGQKEGHHRGGHLVVPSAQRRQHRREEGVQEGGRRRARRLRVGRRLRVHRQSHRRHAEHAVLHFLPRLQHLGGQRRQQPAGAFQWSRVGLRESLSGGGGATCPACSAPHFKTLELWLPSSSPMKLRFPLYRDVTLPGSCPGAAFPSRSSPSLTWST